MNESCPTYARFVSHTRMSYSIKNCKKKESQNRHLCTVCIFCNWCIFAMHFATHEWFEFCFSGARTEGFSLTLLFTSLLSLRLDNTTWENDSRHMMNTSCHIWMSHVTYDSMIGFEPRVHLVPWLIHVCDMTPSCVWHALFMCVTCLIHMYDMTHSWVMCDMTNSYATWIIHL